MGILSQHRGVPDDPDIREAIRIDCMCGCNHRAIADCSRGNECPHAIEGTATNWKGRIREAANRGFFTHDDIKRAMSWAYCDIGERPDIERMTATCRPMDEKLYELGTAFMYAVQLHDPANAAAIDTEIDVYLEESIV